MANNIDLAEANKVLNATLGVTAFPAVTTPMKVALMTNAGNSTTPGLEVSGGGYARQNVVFSSASGGTTSNSSVVSFTNMPAATIVAAEVYDSATTPRRMWQGPVTAARTTAAGDSLSFAATALSIVLT